MNDAALSDRARRAGLAPEWTDASGRHCTVSPDTLRAALEALGDFEMRDDDDMAAPCYPVSQAAGGRRLAALAVQLYALRGGAGFGGLRELRDFVQSAAPLGVDAVAVSPMHAPFLAAQGEDASPYSPSSRLFLNPLYADTGPSDDDAMSELIDWPAAASRKIALLRQAFEKSGPRMGEPGIRLADHARFEALDAHFRAQGLSRWRDWPAGYRDPRSAQVQEFARAHADAVAFHVFVQDLVQANLAAAQAAARAAGMAIGLIADLAVGMNPDGSHAWSAPDDILRGFTVGAPPDIFNPQGQDWGLTALSPAASEDAVRETFAAAMRNAGGVRIDHAMGLARLWVIPQGAGPQDGVYLRYPLRRLLRLLAQQSREHRAIVIGEDLGTVPEGFRDAARDAGMLGMEVLWFQRDGRRFLAPERWSGHAAALTTTHDLPTIAGWWEGRDIDWLERLGRKSEHGDIAAERRARDEDRAHLWSAIGEGDLPAADFPEPVVKAALAFAGRTPCPLAIAPVEDILAQREQPNIPGTIDEHPNWRRRLPPGDVFSTPQARARLEALVQARRAP